jgi:undecaprenyl-diphosphatase
LVIFAIFLLLGVVIGVFSFNQPLFHIINSWYTLLPPIVWGAVSFVSEPQHFILAGLLILLALLFKRDKFLRIIGLVVLYFIVFYGLKHIFHEARPFAVLESGSFNWLNNQESAGVENMSFPSGHVGLAAIFVFALNQLFFAGRKLVQLLLFLFLVLVAVSRVATGWHWPLDVVASGLIGYILVQISFWCSKCCSKNNCSKHD